MQGRCGGGLVSARSAAGVFVHGSYQTYGCLITRKIHGTAVDLVYAIAVHRPSAEAARPVVIIVSIIPSVRLPTVRYVCANYGVRTFISTSFLPIIQVFLFQAFFTEKAMSLIV